MQTPNYPIEERTYYKVDNRIRKAWVVVINYEDNFDDVVITDIYRGELGQKNAGGYEIIKEYSEKYLVPKFIVISYTPEFKNQNIVGEFNKYPNINYDGIKKLLKSVKIAERSSFIYGYKRIGNNEENSKKESNIFW